MIDYLVNILPDFNEQSPSTTEAVKLLQKSEESGVRTLIAAPDYRLSQDTVLPTEIKDRVEELNAVAKEHSLTIQVVSGQRVHLDDDLAKAYERGDILTLNDSQYMLIALGGETLHPRISDILYNLQLVGVRPILAHPERHKEIIEQPEMLYKLVKAGALAQLNASSFTGRVSGYTRKFSEQLIENRLVHFLMSSSLNSKSRSSDFLKAFHTLERQNDGSNAQFFEQNADRLIKDYNIYVDPPIRVKKKRYMGLF
ncbi:tyrosine-protein phosphatase [Alkalicoccobacillus murimartini]|uniref:Tyrosine-protein phosphatase n=1 Tax=Alkalicoccobacillus murimartini TaxID=171685 RepID=A0ABT9YG45_9BACI|nr:CpsB/CapC family capsule biosynthesis tyrosine phosphatase [Alkalicoccobacillus murimartini]MDQ0206838.1 protein-tyrosine phosphatase [Alkalicoccobacillus murimartini]